MSTSGGASGGTNGNLNYAIPSGDYFYPIEQNGSATAVEPNATFRCFSVYVPKMSVQSVCAEVTAAGSAGAVFRLGCYADNGSGMPGALVLDAGTIDGTVVGVSEIALGTPFVWPGGYLWVGGATQGAPATTPTMRTLSGPTTPAPAPIVGLPAAGMAVQSVTSTGVNGALPATLPAAVAASAPAPRLIFRAT